MTGGAVRVLLPCTGLGRVRRGFETFSAQCARVLNQEPGIEVQLVSGGPVPGARRIRSLSRHSRAAGALGALASGRDGYFAEQATFALAMAPWVVRSRPDVVYVTDIWLGRMLAVLRMALGLDYRLLLLNGGLDHPPYVGFDHVQQLAPVHLEEAVAHGVPAARQTLLPHGIDIPEGDPVPSPEEKRGLRRSLGLPEGRPVLLSVAALDFRIKRLDYLIEEVASMGRPRPFLVLLGHPEADAGLVAELARRRLGAEGFVMASVPRSEIGRYYRAADAFVLSSLKEAQPVAAMEAAAHGLPCLLHDTPVTRFTLGDRGQLADLSRSGALATALHGLLEASADAEERRWRAKVSAELFSWPSLAPRYVAMIRMVADLDTRPDVRRVVRGFAELGAARRASRNRPTPPSVCVTL
jgi:1,2-diacylglycerol 3-alpha-glucosyltransferase